MKWIRKNLDGLIAFLVLIGFMIFGTLEAGRAIDKEMNYQQKRMSNHGQKTEVPVGYGKGVAR